MAPLLLAEDPTKVGYEHILLLRAAELDDRFLIAVICGIDGFDIFLETNQRHPTAVHAAAAANSAGALKALLSYRGADVNQEARGETPLMTAAKHNAIEAIELLGTIDGIDPNRKVGGRTALIIATEAGATRTREALLAIKGIEPTV
jgi:ankyrin repeat protein